MIPRESDPKLINQIEAYLRQQRENTTVQLTMSINLKVALSNLLLNYQTFLTLDPYLEVSNGSKKEKSAERNVLTSLEQSTISWVHDTARVRIRSKDVSELLSNIASKTSWHTFAEANEEKREQLYRASGHLINVAKVANIPISKELSGKIKALGRKKA